MLPHSEYCITVSRLKWCMVSTNCALVSLRAQCLPCYSSQNSKHCSLHLFWKQYWKSIPIVNFMKRN